MRLVTATLATKIMRPKAIRRYNFQKNFAYFQNSSHPDLGRVFAREDASHEVRPSTIRTPGEAKRASDKALALIRSLALCVDVAAALVVRGAQFGWLRAMWCNFRTQIVACLP